MARPIDTTKIEKIKEHALLLINQKGFSGTTVDLVAKSSGVSVGYLYRHYESKGKLVQAIYEEKMKHFHDMMFESIERRSRVKYVLSDIIDYLDVLMKKNIAVFNFLFVLLHDHAFEFPKSRLIGIRKICKEIYRLGRTSGEINPAYSSEQVFYTFFSVPFKFFDSRNRKLLKKKRSTALTLSF